MSMPLVFPQISEINGQTIVHFVSPKSANPCRTESIHIPRIRILTYRLHHIGISLVYANHIQQSPFVCRNPWPLVSEAIDLVHIFERVAHRTFCHDVKESPALDNPWSHPYEIEPCIRIDDFCLTEFEPSSYDEYEQNCLWNL